MRRHHYRIGSVAVGLVALAFGIFSDGKVDGSDLRSVAVLIILGGLGWTALARLSRPTDAAYELGRADGHRAGYEAGRRVGRPTVVPLSSRCCGSCARASGENVVSRGRHATRERALPAVSAVE